MDLVQGARTEPSMIGRSSEQRRLGEAIDRVAAGFGAAVLISGEAGVGKTRLARHALLAAGDRGFLVLEGRSNPLNKGLSYGPVVEALARCLDRFDGPTRSLLVEGLPALGGLIEGLGLPPPEHLGDPALEKTRLFEAVARLVDRMARRAPVVLLLDDLQWFDLASLEIVAYLTKDLPELPILLLATYREEGSTDGAGPLPRLLQALRRTGVADELDLEPLEDRDLAALIERLLDGDPPPNLVRWVSHSSGGLPLFVEALVAALQDEGALARTPHGWVMSRDPETRAPPVVRGAIGERLDRLPAPGRRLVEVLAVAGDEVTPALLTELCGGDEINEVLEHLVSAGIIEERTNGELRYRFHHPLTHLVAYEEMPPLRRRRLHARIAAFYEHSSPDDLERLAVHYRGALPVADPVRAIEVSVAAGRRLLDRYAYPEARDHLEAALSLARRHQPGAAGEIMILAGRARYLSGDVRGGLAYWREAMALLEGSEAEKSRLSLMIVGALSEVAPDESDREVLAALRGPVSSEDRVEFLYVLVTNAHRRGDIEATREAARELGEEAERLGADRARALAAAGELTALVDACDYRLANRLLRERGDLFRHGGPILELRRFLSAGVIAISHGDLPALREANRSAQEVVRRSGIPSMEVRVRLSLFVEAFYEGDWERAREIAADGAVLAEATGHPQAVMMSVLFGVILAVFRGDFGESDAGVADLPFRVDLDRLPGAVPWRLVGVVSALAAMERGDASLALLELTKARRGLLVTGLPPWGLVVKAEAEARSGKLAAALETAAGLRLLGPPGSYPDAMADRAEGLAYLVAGRFEDGVSRLAAARSTLDELDLPFEAARSAIEQAEALLRNGSAVDDLRTHVSRAYATFVRLGAQRYAGRARRLLHALGTPLPAEGTPELTVRQLEVARMVARGMSNAEIAERLFISVRTVHSHLDHIYTRLGIGSRAALASYVATSAPST